MEAFWRITRARIRRVACLELVDGCAGDEQTAWTIGLAKRMQVSDLGDFSFSGENCSNIGLQRVGPELLRAVVEIVIADFRGG